VITGYILQIVLTYRQKVESIWVWQNHNWLTMMDLTVYQVDRSHHYKEMHCGCVKV